MEWKACVRGASKKCGTENCVYSIQIFVEKIVFPSGTVDSIRNEIHEGCCYSNTENTDFLIGCAFGVQFSLYICSFFVCGLERESCVRHVSYCYPLDIYALNRIDWRNSARMTEKPIKVIRNDSKKNCLSSIQREIPNNLRCSSHVCLYNIFWTKCRFFILCGGIFSHELSNLAFFECPMIFFLVLNFPGYIYSQIS